jgi:hypothetical protein
MLHLPKRIKEGYGMDRNEVTNSDFVAYLKQAVLLTKQINQYVTTEHFCSGGRLSQLYSGVYTVRIPAETPIILRYFVLWGPR